MGSVLHVLASFQQITNLLPAALFITLFVVNVSTSRIAYRDLKPENVGFDRLQDQLKLIDFGLCKDLSRLKPNASGLYNMTVLTGSARYMAPEVAREDVSFYADNSTFRG